jgi:hypothetical protein
MKIQTFNNMKGLIYGSDPKRILCEKEGVLRIGSTEIPLSADKEEMMPSLFNGSDGDYSASYEAEGKVYDLGKVSVRGGRVSAPPQSAVEMMELRYRADKAEAEIDVLKEEIEYLKGIFDTNSLNFLIR